MNPGECDGWVEGGDGPEMVPDSAMALGVCIVLRRMCRVALMLLPLDGGVAMWRRIPRGCLVCVKDRKAGICEADEASSEEGAPKNGRRDPQTDLISSSQASIELSHLSTSLLLLFPSSCLEV